MVPRVCIQTCVPHGDVAATVSLYRSYESFHDYYCWCIFYCLPYNLTLKVGQDANSSMLRESLLKCGVDLTYLREVAGPCGTALILLQSSGTCAAIDHLWRSICNSWLWGCSCLSVYQYIYIIHHIKGLTLHSFRGKQHCNYGWSQLGQVGLGRYSA